MKECAYGHLYRRMMNGKDGGWKLKGCIYVVHAKHDVNPIEQRIHSQLEVGNLF